VPEENPVTIVLAALDADASARPVLGTAIALAELLDATVVGLHVREHGVGYAPELTDTAGIELREVDGAPTEQIIAAARDPDVAVLVLGARGVHGGPRPAGRTALNVITRVLKPVVVVPPNAQPPARLARVLVPLEGTLESSLPLENALAVAHERRLEVLVLHVHSPATLPAFTDHDPHATQAWEREFLSRFITTPHDRVTLMRRLGVPADDIIAVAHDTATDLITLAWNQNLSPGRARIVSEALARSDIPVLLLPV
jgi:nucleotide-binding universal stress UspA family protein